MGEVLADAAPLGQHILHVGVNVRGGGLVFQVRVDEPHQRQRRLPRVLLVSQHVEREAPRLRQSVHETARLEEVVAPLPAQCLVNACQRKRGRIRRQHRAGPRRHAGVTLDGQRGVWLGNFKVVNGVVIEVRIVPQPGGRQHFQQERIKGLLVVGLWLEPDLVETFANR